MNYEIDNQQRVWLNGGVVVADCGEPWDKYLAWLDEGNQPTQRDEEQ